MVKKAKAKIFKNISLSEGQMGNQLEQVKPTSQQAYWRDGHEGGVGKEESIC